MGKRTLWKTMAVVMGFALLAAACGDDDDDASTATTAAASTATTMADATAGTDAAAAGDIVEVATAAGDFTTLLAAVDVVGLTSTLEGDGPFTVFAPTDEAFAALGQDTIDSLLADPETLSGILLFHVVPGELMAADVLASPTLMTVNGADITVDAAAGTVSGSTTATITATDIVASNGVIHVIDAVLLPPDS